jgi:hypothetical protein
MDIPLSEGCQIFVAKQLYVSNFIIFRKKIPGNRMKIIENFMPWAFLLHKEKQFKV